MMQAAILSGKDWEEVGHGHVHKVSNCGVGQSKPTWLIYCDEQKLFPAWFLNKPHAAGEQSWLKNAINELKCHMVHRAMM